MSTTKHASSKSVSVNDAITALTADHKRVKALFKEFADLKNETDTDEKKGEIVKQICVELTIHAELEEQIFYPAVRAAVDEADLMDEALVEHASAKELIAQLEEAEPDEDLFDAKVTVLGEQIEHHVKEEEGEIFPKAKKAKVDTEQLGLQMAERRTALKTELGVANEGDEHGQDDEGRSEPRKKAGGRR